MAQMLSAPTSNTANIVNNTAINITNNQPIPRITTFTLRPRRRQDLTIPTKNPL